MNDYRYHYLFTTFDIETFDLEDFKYNYVNMTAFRIVDSENLSVKETLRGMENFQPVGHPILNKSSVIKAEPALVFDSVNVFAKGLHALERSATLALANLSCDNETPWDDGSSLFNYINAVEYDGVTGPIKFLEGKRSNFKLDILKLRCEELHKVGEWSPDDGINITDRQAFFEGGKPNITLKVITVEEAPFVMIKPEGNLTANNRYEGFCVDLLKRISFMVGFQYEIEISDEGVYGVIDVETGEWNGLVRGLMDKKADLAVGSMTINYARESVIDFTKPFMNLGISILFKIPTRQPTRLFSFMNPLAIEIWLYVLAAYVLVSFTMFVMARFSPYEWNNPHPCNDEADTVENQFSLNNTFWFITGTLLRQGSGLNPKAASTRIVGGIWWFFTLIIISSYTANLAAFLTVERMITPIESAEDLADQNEIEYGTLEGGSTMAFFRDSKIETYQKMWRFMESKKPSVFVSTIDEGVDRVLKGNYAFLMESTMLDYTIQRNCNLTQIGGLLNSNSYGIATPIGSPWRDKISLAILELQEKGVIQMLYSKWWKNTGDVCNRDDKTKDSKANALGVENIGGVFVVLLCGLALAIVVAILEFCWNSRKNANSERQSLCLEMADELRFALKCHGSRQRPTLRRSCTKCHVAPTTHVPAGDLDPHSDHQDPSNELRMLAGIESNTQGSSLSNTFENNHQLYQQQHQQQYHPHLNSGGGALHVNGVRALTGANVQSPAATTPDHLQQLNNLDVNDQTFYNIHHYSHHQSQHQLHQFQSSTSPLNSSSPNSSPTLVPSWRRRCISLKALAPLPPPQQPPATLHITSLTNAPNIVASTLHSTAGSPPPRPTQHPILHYHQLLNQHPLHHHLLQQHSGPTTSSQNQLDLACQSLTPAPPPLQFPHFMPHHYGPRRPSIPLPLTAAASLSSLPRPPSPVSCS